MKLSAVICGEVGAACCLTTGALVSLFVVT